MRTNAKSIYFMLQNVISGPQTKVPAKSTQTVCKFIKSPTAPPSYHYRKNSRKYGPAEKRNVSLRLRSVCSNCTVL